MVEREASVVRRVKSELSRVGVYHVVFHGSRITSNGTPDVIAHDNGGVFLGIECKAARGRVSIVQWRRALEIIRGGGRFIVARGDFDMGLVNIRRVGSVVHVKPDDDEFSLYERFHTFKNTTEVVYGD